jgi:hypothetical protein
MIDKLLRAGTGQSMSSGADTHTLTTVRCCSNFVLKSPLVFLHNSKQTH